jgi:NAD+ synthase (glutamine-hydrolysing)
MDDFTRIAAVVPAVRPAEPRRNGREVVRLMRDAFAAGADAAVFPELCLTGCTCGDLFFRGGLLESAEAALAEVVSASADCGHTLFVAGLPVRVRGMLFDCAAVFAEGRLLGVVPRSFPSAGPCSPRWFASASDADVSEISLAGSDVLFGADLVFRQGGARYAVEVGDDLSAPCPPSSALASAGANVILNPCAPFAVAGGSDARLSLVSAQSSRCVCAYAWAAAGLGESTTDYVFAGGSGVAENGTVLVAGGRFSTKPGMQVADVDAGFLDFERTRCVAFRAAAASAPSARPVVAPDAGSVRRGLARKFARQPFVPADEKERSARCREILDIQTAGLATRLSSIGCRDVVLGISGGLDSALALAVCVEAYSRLGLDKSGIHAYTMPGFGTTSRTKGNAGKLCSGLGVEMGVADITATVRSHFADMGRDESVKDVTYENAQARARTYFLMDRANEIGGIAVGTGDLSETALGWCTYNGDHMSMYGVNAGVPKTLIRHVVRWYAEEKCGDEAREALLDILDTPVSPELLPATADGEIAQKTEDRVGPYELHDFFLYHFVRRGAGAEKIRRIASEAFAGVYGEDEIEKWLGTFLRRFRTQQFKRSCSPDGPKTGSVGLSPRGDWVMPSDLGGLE